MHSHAREFSWWRPDRGILSLAIMNAVNSVGDGAFAALSVVYLSTSAGLSAAAITGILAIAGVAAMFTGIPLGLCADKVGLKPVFVALCLVEGASVACYPHVDGWWSYLPVAIVGVCAMRATAGIRNALIARTVPPERRVQSRALLRSITNSGAAVGAGVAGLALLHPQPNVLAWFFYADAGTFIVAAVCAVCLPVRPVGRTVDFRVADLARDRAFLTASLGQAGLSLHSPLLTVALPLWIATRTSAPVSVYGLVLCAGTVLAVVLQVPVSRLVHSSTSIGRATWVSGGLLAVMCLLLAPTDSTPAHIATALIVCAAFVRVLADLLQSTAGWAVSFAAPPPGHEATYQATYSTAFTMASAVGPAMSGWIVTRPGGLGWVVAAVAFVVIGQIAVRAAQAVLTKRAL